MAISTTKRWAVLRRDGFRCVYCGKAARDGVELEVDHVLAIFLGGDDEMNLVTACWTCNNGKRDDEPPSMPLAALAAGAICRTPLFVVAIGRRVGCLTYAEARQHLLDGPAEIPPVDPRGSALWARAMTDRDLSDELDRWVAEAYAAAIS